MEETQSIVNANASKYRDAKTIIQLYSVLTQISCICFVGCMSTNLVRIANKIKNMDIASRLHNQRIGNAIIYFENHDATSCFVR